MARGGLRTIAYAMKDIDNNSWEDMKRVYNNFATERDRTNIEREFMFVAVFGLQDPLRDGVKESIEKLKVGGVKVIMLSGDNLLTATQCAIDAAIIKRGDENSRYTCMTGEEFRQHVGGVRKVIGEN